MTSEFIKMNIIITGFCIELFDKIASTLGFTYDVHETQDGFFGSLNEDGTWNGAIRELIEKVQANIKLGPYSSASLKNIISIFRKDFVKLESNTTSDWLNDTV